MQDAAFRIIVRFLPEMNVLKETKLGLLKNSELFLPLIIFTLFLAASLPGISWGAPSLWNPDELVWRVDSALRGDIIFDISEPDYNYPSLPKYVMYAIGYITYNIMGKSNFAFIVSARIFSAILGALGGVLIYYLARAIKTNKYISLLAGVLYVISGIAAQNGRFAHNDLYLQFFTILCVYCLVRYESQESINWLYASFLSVGLATSSKYTGGSLIFLPAFIYILMNRSEISNRWLAIFKTLIIGGLIAFAGYVIGTPRTLTAPIKYAREILIVLDNLRSYGFNSGSQIGLIGQWATLKSAVGIFEYYLFIPAFIWAVVRWIRWIYGKLDMDRTQIRAIGIFILALLIFDIPYLISINYIDRYFIPFVPFLSIIGALFLEAIMKTAIERGWKFAPPLLITVVAMGFIYSALRLVSVALLFMNDPRIPATQYISRIPGYGVSIEYTLYPPSIEKRRFQRAHNYPIYFVEWADDTVPTGGRYEYNLGEKGLLERDTDYFVADSLTYDRFYVDSICATTPVECDFFKRLVAGEVNNFHLVKSFTYELPPYLPDVNVYSVNPDILIFERVR